MTWLNCSYSDQYGAENPLLVSPLPGIDEDMNDDYGATSHLLANNLLANPTPNNNDEDNNAAVNNNNGSTLDTMAPPTPNSPPNLPPSILWPYQYGTHSQTALASSFSLHLPIQ